MSTGDIQIKDNFLWVEQEEGKLVPITYILPEFLPLIQSLTVMHAVCKDTDVGVMREMQARGSTFKTMWKEVVMNRVAEIIAEMTGMQVKAIPITEEMLNELMGEENETKH